MASIKLQAAIKLQAGEGLLPAAFSYNDQNGKSFSGGGSEKKKKGGKKFHPELVEGDFNQHFPTVSGAAASSPYQRYQGSRGNFAGNSKKIAGRKLAQKGDIGGGIGAKRKNLASNNIFVKMSQLIYNFCDSNKRC